MIYPEVLVCRTYTDGQEYRVFSFYCLTETQRIYLRCRQISVFGMTLSLAYTLIYGGETNWNMKAGIVLTYCCLCDVESGSNVASQAANLIHERNCGPENGGIISFLSVVK